ncbi:tRNA (adenosine(37)-N6)-threonylcarbamoyltransferase complex dimerization subunit type 1 TsaB [Cohnella sp. AR92]|uniref:tRNA (adenosine(37)-N6)-threonylcarbamoyltransferase complex dimerization subunit type 1 TsaB n=1 Tax=Cohnella sp. AR92 TaxID=648716 RepID=UPI00131544D9|nr:tRNA (adenosine(37)-N6)-threonylcarbamoyltransferase complex dimerization subunit type 1 TsaB [Cohnella sp. AR92]
MNGIETKGQAGSCTTLALDTSTATLATAVTRDGAVLGSSQSYAERNHSVYVTSQMKELLQSSRTPAGEVDVIAVGQGPGSYTGVRIAVTAAKTLAWIWKKPLVGVSSLEAMAYGFWLRKREEADERDGREVWVVPLMDARRGQVYVARFAIREDGSWHRAEEDGIRLFKEWFGSLEQLAQAGKPPGEVWFVSENGEVAAKLLGEPVGHAAASGIYSEAAYSMDAGAIGLLAEARYRQGKASVVHDFVPNYTQLTEAEVKLNAARSESAT